MEKQIKFTKKQFENLIKKNLGYYARFNFYPYKQTNSGFVNKSESIEKKINNLFQTVSWSDFDLFLDFKILIYINQMKIFIF